MDKSVSTPLRPNWPDVRCTICLDKARCIVYFPCRHFVTCELCAPCIADCPICRVPIHHLVKIHIP